jgi:hypothetical protein
MATSLTKRRILTGNEPCANANARLSANRGCLLQFFVARKRYWRIHIETVRRAEFPVTSAREALGMNRSRMGLLVLALVAFAAMAGGASGGRAATRALSRAVADTGQSVADIQTDAQLPPLPPLLHAQVAK